MRYGRPIQRWELAAIPYLLLTVSQQAGVVTYVSTDGSGERMVYARAATSRVTEAGRYLHEALPGSDAEGRQADAEGNTALLWRDAQLANLGRTPDSECQTGGIVQQPLSVFTRHTWKETVSFSRGDATDLEVQAQSEASVRYVVRMPGRIVSSSPATSTEGNKAEWEVRVGAEPQTLAAESVTVRWGYLALWVYVLLFLGTKALAVAPRVARRIRRKPRKI
jgi:hypothetical protein